MSQTRRQFLTATAALTLLPALPRLALATPAASLTIAARQIEVLGKALNRASVDRSEKVHAFRRLGAFAGGRQAPGSEAAGSEA